MAKLRIQQLSIYLLKPDTTNVTNAIRDTASYTEITLPEGIDGIEAICKIQSPAHPPNWLKFFPATTQSEFRDLLSSSSGSVIFVHAKKRRFAICFGTGWHLLDKSSFVRSFGLRAALRLLKKDTIKAADVSTYDNFAKYRRMSTSKGTEISTFDIEGQMDLLRGVLGECERPGVAHQIGGKDPCVIWTRMTFSELPRLCGCLLTASESKLIEKRFPVIKNISLIRDPSEIDALDKALETQLPAIRSTLHLAPPEVVNWDDVAEFKLAHENAPPSSLLLNYDAITTTFNNQDPTIQELQGLLVTTIRPDGTNGFQQWSAYDCLIAEIGDPQDPTKKFILMAGDWYSVDATFLGEVNTAINAIPKHSSRKLPSAKKSEIEKKYNERLAASDEINLVNLDAKNVSYGGGRSKIEVCDILSKQGCLYHIKDYSGSATLSHLFSQGTVSSRLLLESDFRVALGKKFGPTVQTVLPATSIIASDLEVVYGVIAEANRPIPAGLPFFSKVRLMESIKELRRMGFTNVSVIGIPRN